MSAHILVCPQCHAINDADKKQLGDISVCADCDAPLLPGIPIEVDENLFKLFMDQSSLPLVVEFWGAWSGISHQMAETLSSLAYTFQQDALFLRVDSVQQQVLANSYQLLEIPTFILFTSGQEYHRIQGAISEVEFHHWLERYLRVKRKKAGGHPSSI